MSALPVALHSHPRPVIFSPWDLEHLAIIPAFFPLIGVGADGSRHQDGFILFALRTNITQFTVSEDDIRAGRGADRQRGESWESRYPDYMLEYRNVLKARGVMELSEAEVQQLNRIYEKIAMAEAQRNGYVFYIARLGDTVGKKCDPTRPLLEQLQ